MADSAISVSMELLSYVTNFLCSLLQSTAQRVSFVGQTRKSNEEGDMARCSWYQETIKISTKHMKVILSVRVFSS